MQFATRVRTAYSAFFTTLLLCQYQQSQRPTDASHRFTCRREQHWAPNPNYCTVKSRNPFGIWHMYRHNFLLRMSYIMAAFPPRTLSIYIYNLTPDFSGSHEGHSRVSRSDPSYYIRPGFKSRPKILTKIFGVFTQFFHTNTGKVLWHVNPLLDYATERC
jgi:hypothetical protein